MVGHRPANWSAVPRQLRAGLGPPIELRSFEPRWIPAGLLVGEEALKAVATPTARLGGSAAPGNLSGLDKYVIKE
jgi:hypothetical protein